MIPIPLLPTALPTLPDAQVPQSRPEAAVAATKLDWQVETLWRNLSPLLPGVCIEVLARSESTNTVLLERVRGAVRAAAEGRSTFGRRAEDLQPCLLVAEHQTQGRGRMGRTWLSSSGSSLTFSLGLCLDMQDWSGLSLAVGCALAEALEPSASLGTDVSPRLRLKWPNDLWLDGRKLGGILIETVAAGEQRMVVVGIGLNISELPSQPEASSPQLFSTGFAALNELQAELTAPAVLALIVPALAQALLNFPYSGFAAWHPAFERRDLTMGRAVTAGVLDGIARGVNPQGELLVQTPQGLHNISGGEVSLRLHAQSAPTAPHAPTIPEV